MFAREHVEILRQETRSRCGRVQDHRTPFEFAYLNQQTTRHENTAATHIHEEHQHDACKHLRHTHEAHEHEHHAPEPFDTSNIQHTQTLAHVCALSLLIALVVVAFAGGSVVVDSVAHLHCAPLE